MKFEDIYEPYLMTKGFSFFTEQKEWIKVSMDATPDTPLFHAFIEDHDIQQIEYVSTNIGMVRAWQKVYKNAPKS